VLHALIVFAASEGEHTSKTLFYICGGLAAVYAVVVGMIGITQPDFPRTQGAARSVFALSTVVVILAMATAILTA
jgi:hypothetical protein